MSATLSSQFLTVITPIIVNEGGDQLSLDHNDPGNWTGGAPNIGILKGSKFGISAASYPNVDIASITQADAEQIYYRDYYSKIGGDKLPLAICFLIMDAAVNSGVGTAVEWIQTILGLVVDGNCGPITQKAISQYSNQTYLCKQYCVSHLLHYMQFSNWSLYKTDYTNRTITDAMVAQQFLLSA